MSDMALIAFAAKAAGISHQGVYYRDKGLRIREASNGYSTWIEWWNPLDNDADAFRLSVKMGFIVNMPSHRLASAKIKFFDIELSEPAGSDRYAATRRVIVRAAAEIGKEIE